MYLALSIKLIMKQKKREKQLLKELEAIKNLKDESVDLEELENRMALLI